MNNIYYFECKIINKQRAQDLYIIYTCNLGGIYNS